MSMRRVGVRKSLNAFATIVLILIVNFVLFRLVPGNPADIFFKGSGANPDESLKEQLTQLFGFNDGGEDGRPGYNVLMRDGAEIPLPSKMTLVSDIIAQ